MSLTWRGYESQPYVPPAPTSPGGSGGTRYVPPRFPFPLVQQTPTLRPYTPSPGTQTTSEWINQPFPWDPPPTDNSGDGGGGGGGGGGWSFATSPGYQAALAEQQLGLSQIEANLKAARERAITGFGDPALASLAGFGLDPQAADFARQNYLSGNSTLSRLDKQRDDKRRAIINSLAGSGLLFSGETGYQEGQASQAYGTNVYDARQSVLDYLRQADQQAQDRKAALRQMVIAALQNAYATGGGGPTGSGGTGGGGTDLNDFMYGNTIAGKSAQDVFANAQAHAPAGQTPLHVVHNGEVTNGGYFVKYADPHGGTNTIWIPG